MADVERSDVAVAMSNRKCQTEDMSTDVIDRVLDPFAACLSPEVAQRIVNMRADEAAQQTLDELADKANDGTLTEAEQSLYDEYRQLFHFITILQAKARRFLQNQLAT